MRSALYWPKRRQTSASRWWEAAGEAWSLLTRATGTLKLWACRPHMPHPASAAQALGGFKFNTLFKASWLCWGAQSLCPGNVEASSRMEVPQVPCCRAWLPSMHRSWSPVFISLATACVPHLFHYAPRLSSATAMKELKAAIRFPPALLSLPQAEPTQKHLVLFSGGSGAAVAYERLQGWIPTAWA